MASYCLQSSSQRQRSHWLGGYSVSDGRGLPATPSPPPDPSSTIIRNLCHERQLLASQLHQVTTTAEAAHNTVWLALASSIVLALKPTYSLSPPNISVSCSPEFYNQFTKGWVSYTPVRHRSGYDAYHLCTSLRTFLSCLPGWDLSHSFFVQTDLTQTYRLVASADHPIYAIYSNTFTRLNLSFHYLPDPLPPHFVPHFRFGSVRKNRLHYSVRSPRRRRSQPTPSPSDAPPTPPTTAE